MPRSKAVTKPKTTKPKTTKTYKRKTFSRRTTPFSMFPFRLEFKDGEEIKSVISSAKSTGTNTLKDMECEKINSSLMISPLPNVLMLTAFINSWYNLRRIYTWKHASPHYIENAANLIFSAITLWVQVPQWSDDWSHCVVDVPDSSCHCRPTKITLSGRDLIGKQHHGIV